MMWLAEVPTVIVDACLANIPRLEADERMHLANTVAMGSGVVEEQERRRLWQQWSAAAAPPVRTSAKAVDPGPALAMMGFSARRVKWEPKVAAAPRVELTDGD